MIKFPYHISTNSGNTNYSKMSTVKHEDDTKLAENMCMNRSTNRNMVKRTCSLPLSLPYDQNMINCNDILHELGTEMESFIFSTDSSFADLANEISQIDINPQELNSVNDGHRKTVNNNNQKVIKSKSKKKRSKSSKARKHSKSDDGFGYEPHSKYRARGNIQISKQLTEEIVPCSIQQYILNLYSFMDKLSAMRYFPDVRNNSNSSTSNWGNIEIFNYGFTQKHNNNEAGGRKTVLYTVAEHQDMNHHKSRGYGLKMINRLFTASEIISKYNLSINDLPISIYDTNKYKTMLNDEWKIKSVLMDITQRTDLLKQCQWHKINIFKRINNKRRMTLSCTKPEFIVKVINFSDKSVGSNDINLIPIILFNENERDFVIEWCWIIRIEWNQSIDIAVSFRFDDHNNCVKIKSIHLDRDYLLEQHQMASPNHDCHCFDQFNSYIDDLAIGNPDDLKVFRFVIRWIHKFNIYLLI